MLQRLLSSNKNIYFVTGTAGLIALIIVLLILSSNVSARRIKIAEIPSETRTILNQIQVLNRQIVQSPDDVQLHIDLANSLFDLQKYHAAIPYYKQAKVLAPENIEVRVDLGVSYFNIQMLDSAVMEMQAALELDPQHIQALFNLGVIYYNAGDSERAIAQWKTLVASHPSARESKVAQNLITQIK
jgi:cytochrome c-type biogenesis protein CcmH/NrfG